MSNTKRCGGCLGSGKYIGYGTEANGKTCPLCQGTGWIKCSTWERIVTWGMP